MENIFIPDGCLSERAIFRYLGNDLSGEELIAVETHLSGCEMCSDAVDGFRLMQDNEKAKMITGKIREEVSSNPALFPLKKDNTNFHRFFAYAATLILICGTAVILYQNFKKHENPDISKLRTGKQNPAKIDKLAEVINERQPDTGSGMIASREQASEKIVPPNGKTCYKYDEISLIKKEEENYVADNTGLSDQQKGPVTVTDGEAEQKKPLAITDTKSTGDSDKDGKLKEKPKDIVIAGQVQEANQEVEVVTAQKSFKSRSKYRNEKVSQAPAKNNTAGGAAGDHMTVKGEKNEQADRLEEHTEILKNNPSDYSSLYYSGLSYFNLKKYKKCIRQFDKVILVKNAEFYEDALWYKAQALIILNRKEEALPILDLIITGGKKYNIQAEEKKAEIK